MADEDSYIKFVGELRATLSALKPGDEAYGIIAGRDQVLARYQPVFSSENIGKLVKEEYTSFLYFENNGHWGGLYRKGLQAADNIEALRSALRLLLDESKPIQDRLGTAIDMVDGLGKGTATAILTVAYPATYGVWNNASEAALREAGLWPDFAKGEGIGMRYVRINDLLARMRTDLATDFWTLDALWWPASDAGAPPVPDSPTEKISSGTGGFALERQLEEFLLENWEQTPLAEEWAIYSTNDEPEAGNQFPTSVGRIDILAVHKTQPRLLVIELKRNQGNDQTVGQVLRYMGWLSVNTAKETGMSVRA